MQIARVLSIVSLVLVVVSAEPQAHLHVRVAAAATAAPAPVAQWGQCKWEGRQVACAKDLQCAVSSKWFGMCVKKVAELWEQCGGNGWTAKCRQGKCVKQDNYYSQCRP